MSDDQAAAEMLNSTAQTRLRTIVERAERLLAEKADITTDFNEVMAEAKGEGFDPKILRKVIAWRAKDPAKRAEEEAILDLYLSALGAALPPGMTITVDGEAVIAAAARAPAPAKPQTKLQQAADSEAVAAALGRQAAQQGVMIGANLYEPGSAQHRAFADGHRSESLRLNVGSPA